MRRALGLKQKEFAALIDRSDRMLREYEKGKAEIPQSVRRIILQTYGVEVVPENPSEDPKLLEVQLFRNRTASDIEVSLAQNGIRPSALGRWKRYRARTQYRKNHLMSPMRRILENTINFVYLVAAFVFLIETIQRAIGGWSRLNDYHDALYAGSFLSVLFLLIPTVLISEWGIKSDME